MNHIEQHSQQWKEARMAILLCFAIAVVAEVVK